MCDSNIGIVYNLNSDTSESEGSVVSELDDNVSDIAEWVIVSDSDGVVCDNARGWFVSSVDKGCSENFGDVFVVISNGVVSLINK